jgi:hypothetical protein
VWRKKKSENHLTEEKNRRQKNKSRLGEEEKRRQKRVQNTRKGESGEKVGKTKERKLEELCLRKKRD